METIILLLLAGFCLGFYVRGKRAALELASYEQKIVALGRKEADRQREAARRRQYFEVNDVSDTQNQLRFIGQCDLQPKRPVNREAVKVLYALEEWIKAQPPDAWRLSFEVSMGAFIKTAYDPENREQKAAFSSYNSKRVDFLLVDRYGNPKLVIEYHGSGHDLSDDASERMEVKRRALERAGIPLLEVVANTAKADIIRAISEKLEFAADSLGSIKVDYKSGGRN